MNRVLTEAQYRKLCQLASACHAAEHGDYTAYEAFVKYAAAITKWDDRR